MRASPRTRAWLTVVGALVVVLVAVLLARAGGSDGVAPGATAPSASRTASSTASPAPRTSATDPVSHLRWVDEAGLDAPAKDTLARIRAGGPYRYPRNDDVTYRNANGVLPSERDGYYREYTVVTPGASTRGARRIIAGTGGELYYTTDHYDSVRRIREAS